jgi:hypothetical protein
MPVTIGDIRNTVKGQLYLISPIASTPKDDIFYFNRYRNPFGVPAMVSFPKVPANNPALKGQPAARKQLFGEHKRYAVWPVHTRFDAIQWFVADAEHPLSDTSHAEIIRQADTLAQALEGLA